MQDQILGRLVMWLTLKELCLQISGRFQGRRMVKASSLKGTLMIGRWKWLKTSLAQSILGAADPSLKMWKETKSSSYFVKPCFDLLEGGRQH